MVVRRANPQPVTDSKYWFVGPSLLVLAAGVVLFLVEWIGYLSS